MPDPLDEEPYGQDIPDLDLEANNVEAEARPAARAPQRDEDVDAALKALQAERDDLYNRLARAQAEFQNARKRMQTDADQSLQYANSGLIKSLLPVIDNFERALAVDAGKTDAAGVLVGLQLVHDQMMAVLKGQHVEIIAPAPGDPFDPTKHAALMQQPAPEAMKSKAAAGQVVTMLMQSGYALHGRTLRPASVAVSTQE